MDKIYFQLGAPHTEEHGKAIIVECRDQICSRPIAWPSDCTVDLRLDLYRRGLLRALLMIANSYWTAGFKLITQRGVDIFNLRNYRSIDGSCT